MASAALVSDPPDIASFALFLADRLSASHVIALGGATGFPPGAMADGPIDIIGYDESRRIDEAAVSSPPWRAWDFASPVSPLVADLDLANSVLLAVDPLRFGADAAIVADELTGLINRCLLIVTAAPPDRAAALDQMLADADLVPRFSGLSRSTGELGAERGTAVRVIENPRFPLTRTDPGPPDDFKVVAFVTAYNEEDVIVATIEDLVAQGSHAYVIDNWSTDRTYELAERHLGRGVVGIERYPARGPTSHFDLFGLLTRIEELSKVVEGDWFIKHDSDEARRSPWAGVSLRDGFYRVQLAGYNCVDFTVVNFPPVDNGYQAGSSFVDYFRHFEFGRKSPYFRQWKAWRNFGQDIDYARWGSHTVDFPGRRVFPYKFLVRHYPVRSQQHGERKIFAERKDRFLPAARQRGWHHQYDDMEQGQTFLADPDDLEVFDDAESMDEYLIERLSGVGIDREQASTSGKTAAKAAEPAVAGPDGVGRRIRTKFEIARTKGRRR